MVTPPIIVGAGFNRDASAEVKHLGNVEYPLASDLVDCFDPPQLPDGKSVEDLFQAALEGKNRMPLLNMCRHIMQADYYITPTLLPNADKENNVYLNFLCRFHQSPILTFNYDSLIELILLKLGKWYVEDGFGVKIKARRSQSPNQGQPASSQVVLHLHGSLYVYTSEYNLEQDIVTEKDQPDFLFDPNRAGHRFLPYQRVLPGLDYQEIERRVIAPVPNKAQGLKGEFVKRVMESAQWILQKAETVVCIGYSFNPHDRVSYDPLFDCLMKGARVILVVPEAQQLSERLSGEYPAPRWIPQAKRFREWVHSGYGGL